MNAPALRPVDSEPFDSLAPFPLGTKTSSVRGKTGAVALVTGHVRRITAGQESALAEAALSASLRRVARAGELVAIPRAGTTPFGLYDVRGSGRTWTVRLYSLEPLDGSCACPDFARNSLGLCKHLVAALERALRHRGRARTPPPGPPLRWNPVRPVDGPGDWLARVSWSSTAQARGPTLLAEAAARRNFKNGSLCVPASPPRRLQLVRTLARVASDPALTGLLAAEERHLADAVARPWTEAEVDRVLSTLAHPLFDYQRTGVRRFLESGRLLLADDMGLGKTAQAIAACHALLRSGRAQRAVVIVPAALKGQWAREWMHFSNQPVTVVEGGASARADLYRRTHAGALVINYELALRDLARLQAFAPDVVVLDEAQRIKNWQTRTAQVVKQLTPRYRLALSGTPMENRLDELASLIDWIDDFALEPKWRLEPHHALRDAETGAVIGACHLDTLRERLARCMVRRSREDVLSQLPARRTERVTVPMTAEQTAEHDALDRPIARLMSTAHKRPLTRAEFLALMSLFTRQRLICNALALVDFDATWRAVRGRDPSPALLARLGSPKLLEFRERMRSLVVDHGRKVVVFSQWRRMLQLAEWAISDVLESAKARTAFFTGGNRASRDAGLVQFHEDPGVRVLFATDAGGVGLNLQRASSCVVNLDLPWNPAVLEQRVGRVHRHGQLRGVDVHLLTSRGLESHIASVVGTKQALFKGLFDGDGAQVAFEQAGNFLARLEEVVTPGAPEEPEKDETSAAVADIKALLAQVEVRPAAPGRVAMEAPAGVMRELASFLARLADTSLTPSV